ncbi:efflux RND transporter periplasmic adaptor subunit [Sinorhizobium sp. BG8]|uniref:efflux RND transporter periplasmic adaptor subunit n=1 Tax=Sinorhizobium sp. BG8 TaxID=2613773 RepID=UPI001AFA72ED|nr:efflux RND transporter periplasmic adaptor subunit [Sinorhizobium sp. BG8]QRM56543.1 efflux RND transporter periplasmic adaptor subunit [Sinorhizobium sp. BG8]
MTDRTSRILAAGAVALALLSLSACGDQQSKGPAGMPGGGMMPDAGFITLKAEQVEVSTTLPGRVVALASADIRPRVGGIIEEIAYEEGRPVQKGDVLYKIADDSYVAAVAVADAALQKALASIPVAEANVKRYQELVNSGGTQIELDNARLTLAQARADVASAEATLKSARIDLDLTEVRAPISGVTAVSQVSVGTVVTASQSDALTTVKELDPIYVDMIDSSANLLRIRKAIESGALARTIKEGQVKLTLEDGSVFDEIGRLEVPQFSVSETTGSFSIRTRIANPKHVLLPGMYVRATVSQGTEKGYLVPQLAGSRDPSGNLTAKFLTEDNTVDERVLATTRAIGNNWLVTTGISDGDRLIVDGFQRITTGQKANPVPVTVNSDGIVVEEQAGQTSDTDSTAPAGETAK